MKLSFSNRKWTACSYADLLSLCDATGMQGLELYDVADTLGAPGQPFDASCARSTLHTLIDRRITPVCFDMGSVLDAGAAGDTDVGEEERIAALCAGVEGVGKCQVTVNYDGDALVSVVVLCEGGDSVAVKKRLSDILATLYDVGYNRIMIDRLS